MADNLDRFVEHARQKGMDPQSIFLLLKSAGWKDQEIAAALASRELAMPIPERAGLGTARDTFLHLLAFAALYATAVSLIWLCFAFIEFALPDPAERPSTYAIEAALSGMRVALAAQIVAYPLFVFVWWYLLREVRRYPEKAKGAARRWLSFLSLFVAAVTIATDLIVTIYYFAEGDLTVRFLLKVITILVVAGSVLVYLALTLRSEGEVAP